VGLVWRGLVPQYAGNVVVTNRFDGTFDGTFDGILVRFEVVPSYGTHCNPSQLEPLLDGLRMSAATFRLKILSRGRLC